MKISLWGLVVSVATLAAAQPAHAQMDLTAGDWFFFEWFAPGAVEGGGFHLNATQRMRLRITDAFISGDIFEVFLNSVSHVTTSVAADGIETGTFDGESAWANADLSRADFFLDPGEYLIQITVIQTAAGYDFGEGFIRADGVPDVPAGVVPEPLSIVLLSSGLAGVAAARRRRRSTFASTAGGAE